MSIRIQLRRGTAAQWTAADTVLEDGELGVELDTRRGKFGDGITAWNTLPYADAVAVAAAVAAQADIDGHEASTTAHTAAHVTVDHTAAGLTSGSTDVQAALTEIQAEIVAGDAGEGAALAAEIGRATTAEGNEATTRANADSTHASSTTGVHGVGASTVESTTGSQAKATAAQAAAVQRANHTGTQVASTISDFNTAVRTNRLDQLATAGADVPIGAHKVTGVADPTQAQDAATKAYVDATAQGLSVLGSVVALASTNVALTGLQTIDGVSLVDGDRVLLTGQNTSSQNGPFVAHSGAWTRPVDFPSGGTEKGDFVFVESGTLNGNSGWVMTGAGAVTVDTTGHAWTQFSGAGEITAGSGLAKSGNTLSIPTGGVSSVMIADGTIVDGDVAGANKDGLVGTPSMRTLGTGAQQAAAGNDSRIVGAIQTPAGGSNGQMLAKDSTVVPQGVAWVPAPTSANIDGGTATSVYTNSGLTINGGSA